MRNTVPAFPGLYAWGARGGGADPISTLDYLHAAAPVNASGSFSAFPLLDEGY